MNVIEMILVILFVADAMFPKSLLPKRNSITTPINKDLCEFSFDDCPTSRVVGICFIQAPNTMNVVRQKRPGIYDEGIHYSTVIHRPAKAGSGRFGCKQRFATGGNDREKPGRPEVIAPISWHTHLRCGPWPNGSNSGHQTHEGRPVAAVGHSPTYNSLGMARGVLLVGFLMTPG
jgi:hypothetical protein